MFHYSINPDSDTPIYRQLVDQINAQIRSGALKAGTQMPTVREMADKLHLSCGTVKRVYDTLAERGDIEMTRRRGTFVKYVHEDNKDSRKLRAMIAIDTMVRQLTELNFSPAEIQIFLNLKMREWGMKWSMIRIAVVTEYMELASAMEKRLGQLANVRASVWSLRQIQEYPYSVDEENDVILADVEASQRLRTILPDEEKLIPVAMAASPDSIRALAGLTGSVGVLCEEDAFLKLVSSYAGEICRAQDDFDGLDALVIAKDGEAACSEKMRAKIAAFRREKRVVEFDYGPDAGSMLYLEERIARIRDERQLQPGALRF